MANAVQVGDNEEKVLGMPGVEGVHSFLGECLSKAPHLGVCGDGHSMELLEKVFEEQGWNRDVSIKRKELATLR